MSHIEELLARMTSMEHLMYHVVRGQVGIMRALKLEINMEINRMADFTKLIDEVTKIKGAAASTNAFVAGLQKQLADLASRMNDDADQAAVEALSADLAAVSASLPQAVAANPDAGASAGGITG